MISDKVINIGSHYYLGYSLNGNTFFAAFREKQNFSFRAMEQCRELFVTYFTKGTKYVGFAVDKPNLERMDEFFTLVEDRLKLEKRTIFYRSDKPMMVLAELSPFWRKDFAARQMFTLLLRCAGRYYAKMRKPSFKGAIANYRLARNIASFINHYLNGNTKPVFSRFYYGLVDDLVFSGSANAIKAFVPENTKIEKKSTYASSPVTREARNYY